MTVNTLVRHKKLKTLGIMCISKVHPKHYTINWGKEDSAKCLKTTVEEIDVSKCKTMTYADFRRKGISNSYKENECTLIIGNVVKHYVGIGWVDQHVVTEQDLLTIPRVV